MTRLFRPNNFIAVAGQPANANAAAGQSGGVRRQSLRYQTEQHFGNWKTRSRKRAGTHFHDTFNKDVILLPKPSSSTVVKHRLKQQLHEKGHILNGFEFHKSWDQKTVIEQVRDAFGEEISSDVSLEFMMACGHRLILPKLRAGQELDASLIHKVYKSKALYIRPSRPVVNDISGNCSEDNSYEENIDSSMQSHPSRDTPSYASLDSPVIAPPLLGETASVDPLPDLTCENSVNLPHHSSFPASNGSSNSRTAGHQTANYEDYRSIMDVMSDMSSDDELNQAILQSLQTKRRSTEVSLPAKDILQQLAEKINHQKKCKFNINRSTVLDGAIRGFRRGTYDPYHSISVRFSDDMGVAEEGVDLGGPRREFLRLLIEALPQSAMFEGQEGKMNLALDSTAMREDTYFIAGRAISVSLVHGGPPAGFLSPTLFSCLVDGPEGAKPVLEDVADSELREKIKRVTECTSFENLLATTEPLEEYLANAGCLRPLRRLEDKNMLIDDILMFQVIHRVRGPFERFRDGLRTLGVLDKIQAHPESFCHLLCWSPATLTADLVDSLFSIRLSPVGSNRRHAEEIVVPFWRDYLTDAEDKDGAHKLGTILAFATGADTVPPIGFSPHPSIEFLHPENATATISKLPIANTCINSLKLPLHTTYKDFEQNMDFALGNTHGFGIA